MITEFVMNQHPVNIMIILFVLIYGLAYGVRNTFLRFVYLFVGGGHQGAFGKFLDMSWYVSIAWLVILFNGL